jgi:eukaryotic-like serine/threonine-protein kinase
MERVGRYLLFDEFARGGMATVHLARLDGSVGFKRILAIKRLRRDAADAELRASIRDEAQITSRIVHRNVVQLLDVIEDNGDVFLVMEYVHGLPLSALMKETRLHGETIPPKIATAIVADALDGLTAAHEATDTEGKPLEIVHRDMSPQNLLVDTSGVTRVLDFGIAKARVRVRQTAPGMLKGKVPYMAPEQIHGRATRSSDLFSTGLVLYEALSGERAVGQFASKADALSAILRGQIRPLCQLCPQLPSDLVAIVDRSIARDPEQRFASARQMADALRAWGTATPDEVACWVASLAKDTLDQRRELVRLAESSKESGVLVATLPRQRWLRLAAAGVAIVLALGAVGVRVLWRRSRPSPNSVAASLPPEPPNVVPTATKGAEAEMPSVEPPAPASVEAFPVTEKRPPPPPRPIGKRGRSVSKNCDPPFLLDKNGHKQFKPECF